jgi:hypothetical protein
LFFWHVGGTVGIIRYAFRDARMDLRPLMLGAVAPDLIDKPIALISFDRWQSVRLVGHSLAFASALMVAVLVLTRRGRPRKRWMPLAVGVLVHLFLDLMWTDPETLWWPLLGSDFTATDSAGVWDYAVGLLRSPWTWTAETVGLAYLAYLWVRGGLNRPGARRAFAATGRIDVPIEP